MKSSPSRTGDISEIKAAAWLMSQGYEVFRNMGSTGPADLIAWKPKTNEMIPVDVKTAKLFVRKDGVKTFNAAKKAMKPGVRYLLYVTDQDNCVWFDQLIQ